MAGHCGEPIFDADSISLIARESDGIPRNINNICYNSLLLSCTRGHRTVTAEIVREAVASLDMESLASEPLTVANSVVTPDVSATAAKVPGPHSAPIAAPNIEDRRMNSYLTYDAGKKISLPRWPVRSAILAVILLSGALLLAILGRSNSKQGLTPAIFDHSSDALGAVIPADRSEGMTASFDAAPQDTENGQVITVVAGPQQTLRDLSLRYVGHFDSDLSKKICSLNPDLKDPDHLEAGQLIRIPLPPGAMRKVNDTAEAGAPSETETSGSLFTRFTALLRERK